jgi:DNA-binding LytR/AlgR family response regulator
LRLLERQLRVDLLFSDVVLPGGLTGAQVGAQARAMRPGLKVLFTTGYARNAIIHHGRLDKGVHLITKPFSLNDLAAKIRDVLDAPGQPDGTISTGSRGKCRTDRVVSPGTMLLDSAENRQRDRLNGYAYRPLLHSDAPTSPTKIPATDTHAEIRRGRGRQLL